MTSLWEEFVLLLSPMHMLMPDTIRLYVRVAVGPLRSVRDGPRLSDTVCFNPCSSANSRPPSYIILRCTLHALLI